ncbi:MAG: TrpB-like pyridoxal phosphate-dependent enzyme [Nitrososphaerota archaeon]|nr:TrpB-like pyridoxal phosphate-dependent enzyme [Aigarchaeota archaeon]MDW8076250.1 TrpB-like pyridoxal phosphate-dependent enzyme [Nitrososphaerota archaeon]
MVRDSIQVTLSVDDLPKYWYNILADLPERLPEPLNEDGRLERLKDIILQECIRQESSTERLIKIPEEVKELYLRAGRPRPLHRAVGLEKKLKTPARLYYKREDLSPTGSHKVNTALAQVYYAANNGYSRVVTETGAGQWGTAVAYAASLMNLRSTVYWVREAYEWKTERRRLMRLYGAEVLASPSEKTDYGRRLLKEGADKRGTLGIAISEASEDSLRNPDTTYVVGSVLNYVLLHQTIIGLEVTKQLELLDVVPDVMIGCLGGGSNFGGFILPMVGKFLRGEVKKKIRFLAAQSEAAPNLVKGTYQYDFPDAAQILPRIKGYTLTHSFKMPSIWAEGLRYHMAAPIISYLRDKGLVEAVAYPKDEKAVFEAARMFIQAEGFIPAPESSYAIRAMVDEALKAKATNDERVIVANISGHGFLDLEAYGKVLGI